MMTDSGINYAVLYHHFEAPIARFDCGKKCAPYNELAVPFCCDTQHAVPTAYLAEWTHLSSSTDLWHLWQSKDPKETERLHKQTPESQVLIECKGYQHCQRSFRSITCRAFPFFPYITHQGEFVGLSYYWEYEDRCWVISNLKVVTQEYRRQFILAYETIFSKMPLELKGFRHHSRVMRQVFGQNKRAIPLLHRNGYTYKISPHNGRKRRIPAENMSTFGPYKIAALMPFPDEL